jgi:hypothetical protein
MSKTPISGLAILVALSVTASWTARADAPSACKFLTTAAVSAALGKPVTGGTASSCTYMAGTMMVLLSVDERGTAGAAMEEYHTQLDNSHIRDKDKKGAPDEQKTVLDYHCPDAAGTECRQAEQDDAAVRGQNRAPR